MGLTFVPRSQRYVRIACIDFETYYDKEYSLRSKALSTTDYIRHENYKTHCMGVQFDDWSRPLVVAGDDIADLLHEIDWNETAFLGHHTQFDGLIATHHYGIRPAFWLDTMSMSRTVFGTDVSHSHINLSERLGRKAKQRADALVNTMGLRDLPDEVLDALADYCGDDVSECLANFRDLAKVVSEDELRIIDATIRMYTEPMLRINGDRVAAVLAKEVEKKADAFDAAREVIAEHVRLDEIDGNGDLHIKTLKSANKFAEQLRELGVEPPTKVSKRQSETAGHEVRAFAFSKNDLEFKALEKHPNARVRALVKGRIHAKSELIEARSRRILNYAGQPVPIYLGYWAAHTGRWGGGDKVNWQNLPRRGDGVELRLSIEAPIGCLLVISDASQIEARLNAWDSGQWDKVEAFARGVDVYRESAAKGYNKPYEEITDDERFVFKTMELGGGYGAGHSRINHMFRIGQFGPPLEQTIEETRDLVSVWRMNNAAIVQNWKKVENDVRTAFLSETTVESGAVTYQGYKGDGFMHLPGGTYVRYPRVGYDPDSGQMFCKRGNADIKLWGGILVENRIQALARKLLVWNILEIERCAHEAGIDHRWVGTTHDELMYVVGKSYAQEFGKIVKEVMCSVPPWAEGLPVDAKVEVSPNYSKS